MMRGLHRVVLAICAVGAIANANAQSFDATQIGSNVNAFGLNNLGQVVGTSSGGVLFETGPDGQGMTFIEPSLSSSVVGGVINDLGKVCTNEC